MNATTVGLNKSDITHDLLWCWSSQVGGELEGKQSDIEQCSRHAVCYSQSVTKGFT